MNLSEIPESHKGGPLRTGPLRPMKKLQKFIMLWRGCGHPNFVNPFDYGESLPDNIFKKNWNPNPIQPLDTWGGAGRYAPHPPLATGFGQEGRGRKD